MINERSRGAQKNTSWAIYRRKPRRPVGGKSKMGPARAAFIAVKLRYGSITGSGTPRRQRSRARPRPRPPPRPPSGTVSWLQEPSRGGSRFRPAPDRCSTGGRAFHRFAAGWYPGRARLVPPQTNPPRHLAIASLCGPAIPRGALSERVQFLLEAQFQFRRGTPVLVV